MAEDRQFWYDIGCKRVAAYAPDADMTIQIASRKLCGLHMVDLADDPTTPENVLKLLYYKRMFKMPDVGEITAMQNDALKKRMKGAANECAELITCVQEYHAIAYMAQDSVATVDEALRNGAKAYGLHYYARAQFEYLKNKLEWKRDKAAETSD